jgi:hypothetical protein
MAALSDLPIVGALSRGRATHRRSRSLFRRALLYANGRLGSDVLDDKGQAIGKPRHQLQPATHRFDVAAKGGKEDVASPLYARYRILSYA